MIFNGEHIHHSIHCNDPSGEYVPHCRVLWRCLPYLDRHSHRIISSSMCGSLQKTIICPTLIMWLLCRQVNRWLQGKQMDVDGQEKANHHAQQWDRKTANTCVPYPHSTYHPSCMVCLRFQWRSEGYHPSFSTSVTTITNNSSPLSSFSTSATTITSNSSTDTQQPMNTGLQ